MQSAIDNSKSTAGTAAMTVQGSELMVDEQFNEVLYARFGEHEGRHAC